MHQESKIMKNPWTTLTENTVYENPWIKVTHRDVLTPAKTEGIYGVVHFKNIAVAVVPLDQNYNTWLVGQYRYTINEYSWEVPEGGGPLGSDPLESARRELIEETGIRAEKWTLAGNLHMSNSVTDETGLIYVAQQLSFGEAAPEETEELKIKKLPFDEVVEMVINNEITDALAVCAILKTKALIDKGIL